MNSQNTGRFKTLSEQGDLSPKNLNNPQNQRDFHTMELEYLSNTASLPRQNQDTSKGYSSNANRNSRLRKPLPPPPPTFLERISKYLPAMAVIALFAVVIAGVVGFYLGQVRPNIPVDDKENSALSDTDGAFSGSDPNASIQPLDMNALSQSEWNDITRAMDIFSKCQGLLAQATEFPEGARVIWWTNWSEGVSDAPYTLLARDPDQELKLHITEYGHELLLYPEAFRANSSAVEGLVAQSSWGKAENFVVTFDYDSNGNPSLYVSSPNWVSIGFPETPDDEINGSMAEYLRWQSDLDGAYEIMNATLYAMGTVDGIPVGATITWYDSSPYLVMEHGTGSLSMEIDNILGYDGILLGPPSSGFGRSTPFTLEIGRTEGSGVVYVFCANATWASGLGIPTS